METLVKPRNVNGRMTCPPGYDLRSDGWCYLVNDEPQEKEPSHDDRDHVET